MRIRTRMSLTLRVLREDLNAIELALAPQAIAFVEQIEILTDRSR